ncbi:hypothetical protein H6F75_20330 [Nodosilinea sp. FACHB-131]|uniref:hypothetical protein n=1 Tax=Cyanophyceae TaxID=3028117 RepID=UPI0016831430|nr:hypothetical protein [Nodosilinea sp. FACHB-131]MBD1875835.1 hypothetical protein [Nodosilinea sp. FACHB-131]
MTVLIGWLLVAQGMMAVVNGSIPFSETARATSTQLSLGLAWSSWTTLPGFVLLSQSLPVLGQDSIPYPPILRHETSPAGNYHLILTLGKDEAGARRTTASLFETLGDRCQQVWSHTLPHSYGPRLALVNDTGTVVLLDEWISVASSRAIVVLGLNGEVEAQHSFDDIVEVTGQSRAEVVDQAAQGFWLSGNPEMEPTGDRLTIPTAGGQLSLDLATGEMGF